jgi:hypothetical protein
MRNPAGFPLQSEYRLDNNASRERVPACFIPWSAAEIAYAEYALRYGRQQSLERLAERGGFGRDEFIDLLVQAAARAAAPAGDR